MQVGLVSPVIYNNHDIEKEQGHVYVLKFVVSLSIIMYHIEAAVNNTLFLPIFNNPNTGRIKKLLFIFYLVTIL